MNDEFISRTQQKHIHALLSTMADLMSQNRVMFRMQMKKSFAEAMDYTRDFSLRSDCCKVKEFSLFKSYCLDMALDNGLIFSDIVTYFDDLEQYAAMCIKYRVCCVTGLKHDPDSGYIVDIHHVDTVGMGNDRNTVNHADYRRMALCRRMHINAHSMGQQSFEDYYHVVGVKTTYQTGEYAEEDIIDSGKVDLTTEVEGG